MKTVIITGGSEGLGKSIAEQLVPTTNVYILSRSPEILSETAREIGCKFKICDVSEYIQVESVFSEIMSETGSLDVVINNAGLWIEGAIDECDYEKIKKVIEVNVIGVINCSKAAVPFMKKQGSGLIVQINSQSGLYGKNERSVYHASKWAITGFTKSLQEELSRFKIKVTGLYPAKLKTGLFEKQGIDKNMDDALDTKEVAKTVKFIIEMGENTFFPEIGIKE
jgi:short-subunit dehydrogenase